MLHQSPGVALNRLLAACRVSGWRQGCKRTYEVSATLCSSFRVCRSALSSRKGRGPGWSFYDNKWGLFRILLQLCSQVNTLPHCHGFRSHPPNILQGRSVLPQNAGCKEKIFSCRLIIEDIYNRTRVSFITYPPAWLICSSWECGENF